MPLDRPTASSLNKTVLHNAQRSPVTPIQFRSKTPARGTPTTPLSPSRRINPDAIQRFCSSNDIKKSLDNVTPIDVSETNHEVYHRRQVGSPTKHTENIVFPKTKIPDNFSVLEAGQYRRRKGYPQPTHDRERSMRRHGSFGQKSDVPMDHDSAPYTPSPSSPIHGCRAHTPPSRAPRRSLISMEPDPTQRTTPIYCSKLLDGKVCVLPNSSERRVDPFGNVLNNLKAETEKKFHARSPTPTGRRVAIPNIPPPTQDILKSEGQPSPRSPSGRSTRSRPREAGNVILGTTDRDVAPVHSLHVLRGAPNFVPEPKPTSNRIAHTRLGTSRPEDHDMFGNRPELPPPSPRNPKPTGRSTAYSPHRATRLW
eukprot:PhM_4_TR13671/c1_g1_i1/m.19366